MSNYYIKADRTFTPVRKYGWLFTVLVAIGGLFVPQLGLLVILIMLGLMITSFFKGRFWCGNICPHGSLYDNIINKISLGKNIPKFMKSSILKWGFFLFFMGMFTLRIVRVLNFWGTETFINELGFVFVLQYLIMPTILGVSLAFLISPRAWCNFCPMGTFAEIMYKIGSIVDIKRFDQKIKITAPDKCKECGACAQACPLELEPYKNFNNNDEFTDISCMKCGKCVDSCPLNILTLEVKEKLTSSQKNIPFNK